MILVIDIGNTNIVIGCINSNDEIIFMERSSTNASAAELECASVIKTAFDIHNIDITDIEGAIISSVVPTLTDTVKKAIEKFSKNSIIIVNPGIKTGLKILIDNPAQLGSDLVVNAVAGINDYSVPQIIFDMGTATTLSVIDKNKCYIGGAIMAGIQVSADALAARASLISKVACDTPEKLIGTNTVDCLKSGMMYYNASAIDGMIERVEEELGEKCTVIATGGFSGKVIPLCKHNIICDAELLLKGLLYIYKKNIRLNK